MGISAKHREFLIGLEKLTRKTGVKIQGYALDVDWEVIWVSESDKISWNLYSKKVIKR